MATIDPLAEWKAKRRRQRRAADAFVAAACSGDKEALADTFDELDVTGSWGQALQAIAKAPSVPLDLRKAFGLVVAGSGDSLRSQVGNDLILIPGLRALLPPYEGQSVRLYRGDSARNRKRRTYGLSWSTDQAVAESFARRTCLCAAGGSVLLETVAPPTAVICCIHELDNGYAEDEFLVDRRRLGPVKVLTRFPEAPLY